MKIQLNSVSVDDQDRALAFYTEVLGFAKKNDLPAGEFRWLTVVSPEGPDDVELLLEPNAHPATAFAVENTHKEYERLTKRGVEFRMKPSEMGSGTLRGGDDHRRLHPRLE
ncbi:MAG: VOC family protein [Acidobacteria bacterium]|nr:VOC family protein [Acidobacteriota bacterium]